jgi:hypothetical protein
MSKFYDFLVRTGEPVFKYRLERLKGVDILYFEILTKTSISDVLAKPVESNKSLETLEPENP